MQEGDVCTHFHFIVRGCLRSYKIEKGNTHILQFAAENNWISDLGSFHNRKPSALNIDALEDTVVLQISYNELVSLYITTPKFDRIVRVLIENGFIHLQDRLLQNISSTAEERYISFLELFWVMKYSGGEDKNGRQGSAWSEDLQPYLNGEYVDGKDIVLWYCGHLSHEAHGGGDE